MTEEYTDEQCRAILKRRINATANGLRPQIELLSKYVSNETTPSAILETATLAVQYWNFANEARSDHRLNDFIQDLKTCVDYTHLALVRVAQMRADKIKDDLAKYEILLDKIEEDI